MSEVVKSALITVTNGLPSGSMFAVTTDTPIEHVFIPRGVAQTLPLRVGSALEADLVPNPPVDDGRTPRRARWLATQIRHPRSLEPKNATEHMIFGTVEVLLGTGGVWLAEQVARRVVQHGAPAMPDLSEVVQRALSSLVAKDRAAVVEVKVSGEVTQTFYTRFPDFVTPLVSPPEGALAMGERARAS